MIPIEPNQPVAIVQMTYVDAINLRAAVSAALSENEGTDDPHIYEWRKLEGRLISIVRSLSATQSARNLVWLDHYGLRFVQGPNRWADGPFPYCPNDWVGKLMSN